VKYEVSVTSRAKRQLAESALWWAENRDSTQALRWLDGFEAAISSLADNPERHGVARENDLYELPYVVRQLVYGVGKRPTHRAVFEVRSNIVYVVAIRHLAQADLTVDELS
jgi:plasmid stabilization system protein ParE